MKEIRDTEGRTADEFLAELFEFEYCEECGGDVEDHDPIPMTLGAYSDGVLFFARCRSEAP